MSMTESRPHGRSGPIAGPGVGRHLLIVDDDDRIRELLKEFLAREGYRVTGAAHAAAAKRMMELIEFDLVVLVRPEAWGDGVRGAVDRYVAMTRATSELVILG